MSSLMVEFSSSFPFLDLLKVFDLLLLHKGDTLSWLSDRQYLCDAPFGKCIPSRHARIMLE